MKIPATREEIEPIVKKWGWTATWVLLALLIFWQGLTLRHDLQSWRLLKKRTDILLTGQFIKGESKEISGGEDPNSRVVEATFFYHPKSEYQLTAILGDYAVINGQEVRVGARIERAIVQTIEPNSVTILEDGKKVPKTIELHEGLVGKN